MKQSPTFFVPFGDWIPDPPDYGVGGLKVCKNLVPLWGGYRSVKKPETLGTLENDHINSAFLHLYTLEGEDGDGRQTFDHNREIVYAGSKHRLYEVTLEGSFADVSRETFYGWPDPEDWQFATWGESVVATNFVDPVQILTEPGKGGEAKFDNMIDSTGGPHDEEADTGPARVEPKAKFVGVIANHVILANILLPFKGSGHEAGVHPNMVWWSAVDNEAIFSNVTEEPALLSDFQALRDIQGQITGIATFPEHALIFSEYKIHLMRLIGGDFLFDFTVLAHGIGTIFPRSILPVDRDVYFIDQGGNPKVIRNLSQPQDLADDQVIQELLDFEVEVSA